MPTSDQTPHRPWTGTPQDRPTDPGPFAIAPVPLELLATPLDYLLAENRRILRFCDTLDMVAADTGRIGRLVAPALIGFARVDLPRHLDDMEKDLLPLVEGALLVGDDAGGVLAQLSREHAVDRREAERLIGALEPLAEGCAPHNEPELCLLAHAVAEAQRRHVAWEEMVLYPLARARLHPGLLRSLSHRLARRRG